MVKYFSPAQATNSNEGQQVKNPYGATLDVVMLDISASSSGNGNGNKHEKENGVGNNMIQQDTYKSVSSYNPTVITLGPKGNIKSISKVSELSAGSYGTSNSYSPSVLSPGSYTSTNSFNPSTLSAESYGTSNRYSPISSAGSYAQPTLSSGSVASASNYNPISSLPESHNGINSYSSSGLSGFNQVQHSFGQVVPISQHIEVKKPVAVPVYKNIGKIFLLFMIREVGETDNFIYIF